MFKTVIIDIPPALKTEHVFFDEGRIIFGNSCLHVSHPCLSLAFPSRVEIRVDASYTLLELGPGKRSIHLKVVNNPEDDVDAHCSISISV